MTPRWIFSIQNLISVDKPYNTMDITRRELVVGGSSAIVGGSVGFAGGMAFEASVSDNTDTESTEDEQSIDITTTNRATLGSTDAPIKMVYWSDYQCPFCYRFETNTLPQLINQFVENNTLELIVKPLSVFGNGSRRAAIGSHCVLEQTQSVDNWFQWHNLLYEEYAQNGERNNGWAAPQNQADYAQSLDSISPDELQQCIQSEQYTDRLQTDYTEADSYGFEGTPFFLLYNNETNESETITGAQPFSRFETQITTLQN